MGQGADKRGLRASLELVGNHQQPGRSSAERQVVGVQILQGAARLDNDSFHLVLVDSQRRGDGQASARYSSFESL
jgi:hypothetical protein